MILRDGRRSCKHFSEKMIQRVEIYTKSWLLRFGKISFRIPVLIYVPEEEGNLFGNFIILPYIVFINIGKGRIVVYRFKVDGRRL